MSNRFRMSACAAAVVAMAAWAFADPPQNADVIGGEEGIPFINDDVTFDPAANCECNTVNDRLGASDCAPGEFCFPTSCTPIVAGCGGGRACNGECFVLVELFNNLPDDGHIPGGGFGGFDVMGGIGVYSYAVDGTSVKRFGVVASALEIGYTLGLGYTYDLLDRLGVGGELRLYQFTDRPITVVMPALRVRMSIIEY